MKMNSQMKFVDCKTLGKMIGLGVLCLQMLFISAPLAAQDRSQHISSEVTHVGTAEMRSVTKTSGFIPDRQPVVYWHDEDWKIDLTPQSLPNAFTVTITSSDGREKVVKLPWEFSQIVSISRTPNDEAIVTADLTGMIQAFCIIDLREGKITDNIALYDPIISPDRRFILFNNWYPPHVGGEEMYRIYDVLKTPRENTCGYRENDPRHEDLDGGYRGFQVYPQTPGQILCTSEDDEDDNSGFDFLWDTDSSKVVFADVKSGVMSLILVTMPHGDHDKDHDRDHDGDRDRDHDKDNDHPRTSIYSFVGAENVCGAVGPLGPTGCDYNNVKSIAWNGDAVNVALVQANPTGPAIVKNLTIPLSKFVPLAK
jgi:hypothetical protein